MTVRIGFKTSPQHVDWTTLDETWAAAAEEPVLESGWLNDHLTDQDPDVAGPSYEGLTLLATLLHRLPGREVGIGVLANTFRHPAVLAKAATILDTASQGRFLLGIGAGWFEGEHVWYGIPLPPIGERISRLESAVGVLKALFSPEAATPAGVTRPDPYYPLSGATNLPPVVRPGGPPLILGGQKRRGIALAARQGDGWILPGLNAGDATYLSGKRDELLRAMADAERDPSGFRFVGQVHVSSAAGTATAREQALTMARSGATDVVLGIRAAGGPELLRTVVREVAVPLREALG